MAESRTSEGIQTSASESGGLPAMLKIKYGQMGRLESLHSLKALLPNCAPNTTLEELEVFKAHVDELHEAFLTNHAVLEAAWPADFVDHEYFSTEMFLTESQCVFKLKLRFSQLSEEPEKYQHFSQQNSLLQPKPLPDIKIKTFKGDFMQWSAFKEQFSALVNNDHFTERLHHLRRSVQDEPALILTKSSNAAATFKPAWALLAARYENKRLNLNSQLDKLFNITPLTSSSATALKNLLAIVDSVDKTIAALGMSNEMWNCVLVHHVARCLTKSMREAWEKSLKSTHDYPQFSKLEAFIKETVRASSASSSSRGKIQRVQERAPTQVHHSTSAISYQCDCCEVSHFVVMCPQFRQMSIPDRRKLITEKQLCHNCCGRHTTANCRSALRCKLCMAAHHTMLHLRPTQSQPKDA